MACCQELEGLSATCPGCGAHWYGWGGRACPDPKKHHDGVACDGVICNCGSDTDSEEDRLAARDDHGLASNPCKSAYCNHCRKFVVIAAATQKDDEKPKPSPIGAPLTVGSLRATLAGLPDDMIVEVECEVGPNLVGFVRKWPAP